jgi:hypothetical protein
MLPWHHLVEDRRWIFLPRAHLHRQNAAFVAGAAHERRLHLVVTEDVAAQRRSARQNRQMAILDKGLDAHHGVMAPERTAIAHPPGLPHGVAAHAVPHAELEDAREGRLRRHADNQALEDADLRIGLHHAHQLDDGLA